MQIYLHPDTVPAEGPDILQAAYGAHWSYSEGISFDDVAGS